MEVSQEVFFKRIKAFEGACHGKFEEGSIPVFSNDREEQKALDAAHAKINKDYSRAYKNLAKITSIKGPNKSS
jgi:hypothetical protein